VRSASRRAIAAALTGVVLTAAPVWSGDGARREGSCSGPGHWTLRVGRESTSTLRVRFTVRDADEGDTWQVFLSDDGHRVFAGTRVAGDDGRFRVRTVTRDRAGHDRIDASAIDADTGHSCEGALRY
jgi:hypothetical protein